MKRYSRLIAAVAAAGALCASSEAGAQTTPACSFGPNTVYVGGSSASMPYLASLATVLAQQATPITLVYDKLESCQGVTYFQGATALTGTLDYWPLTADGGAGALQQCTFQNGATPPVLDLSVSDVYAATCQATLPATQQEIGGPIQAMTFIVNPGSSQTSISAEAAHVILGDIGGSYPLPPWTDPNQIFTRESGPNGSGTRAMISAAINLSDTLWSTAIPGEAENTNNATANPITADGGLNNVMGSSGNMESAIASDSANAEGSLGILSVTNADSHRPGVAANDAGTTGVKVLAFQAAGQTCGYFPDSTQNAFDKINVREGRYDIWGPLHFISSVNGTGQPIAANQGSDSGAAENAAVQAFVQLVTLNTNLQVSQKMAVIAAAANAFVVAQCAMRVQRTQEVGPMASFLPPESCGCYWESVASGAAPASCQACSQTSDCPADAGTTATPTCRYGFCEAN